MSYFTNPTKINYTFASTDGWAVVFADSKFNIIESADGTPLFPSSDVSFKELGSTNASLNIGIGGSLDLGTTNAYQLPTKLDLTFVDNEQQDINSLIRDWILGSPVYKFSRTLSFHKISQYTKEVTVYKLGKDGSKINAYGKQTFTCFPSGDIVQLFNSDPGARVDKLELRLF